MRSPQARIRVRPTPSVSVGGIGPRMRVGYYLFAPRLGGAEAYARDVIQGLDRERFEPVVFLPPWEGLTRFLGVDVDPGVIVHTVDTREPSVDFRSSAGGSSFGMEAPPSAMRRLAKRAHLPAAVQRTGLDALRYMSIARNRKVLGTALAGPRLDILHVINGGYPGAVSALAATLAGRAHAGSVVLTVCSTAMPRTLLAPVERVIDRRVAEAVDAIIVPAERPATALRARGFLSAAIRTIPWGISAPAPGDRDAARHRLGLGADHQVVVGVSNFTPTKGQSVVVEAVAQLRSRFPTLRVILAGDGPCRGDVVDLAARLGVSDAVSVPGVLEQPWDLLRAADIFVLASEIEGLPLAVLEALSQGLPVVATDVGGMPEAVVAGVTGLLVPPRQPAELAVALEQLLADPGRRGRMGSAARARYQERFTLEAMLQGHQRLYQNLATGRDN